MVAPWKSWSGTPESNRDVPHPECGGLPGYPSAGSGTGGGTCTRRNMALDHARLLGCATPVNIGCSVEGSNPCLLGVGEASCRWTNGAGCERGDLHPQGPGPEPGASSGLRHARVRFGGWGARWDSHPQGPRPERGASTGCATSPWCPREDLHLQADGFEPSRYAGFPSRGRQLWRACPERARRHGGASRRGLPSEAQFPKARRRVPSAGVEPASLA